MALGWSVGARLLRWLAASVGTLAAFFAAGYGLVTWSVAVNRSSSGVVRVQADLGHTIISSGPYRYVRHPGYIAMLLSYGVIGLAIGSWWSLVPGISGLAAVLRRALPEDAYLLEHLPGYPDYAATVRYRLIPGVW